MWKKRAKNRSDNTESETQAAAASVADDTAASLEDGKAAASAVDDAAQQEAILEEIIAEFSSRRAPELDVEEDLQFADDFRLEREEETQTADNFGQEIEEELQPADDCESQPEEAPQLVAAPESTRAAAVEKETENKEAGREQAEPEGEMKLQLGSKPFEGDADAVTIPFQARKVPQKHKKLKIVLLLMGFLVLLAGAVAAYFYFRVIPVEKVTLSQTELTLREGETLPLHYTLEPSGADSEVTWRSSASHVATVRNGVVTAVGEGSCTVTASAPSGAKGICRVTVRLPLMEEEKELLGEWKLYATSDLGRIRYYYGSAYVMQFYSDRTGYLTENGEVVNFEWEYEETVNGYETYAVLLEDGRNVRMERNTNTGDMMNNTLTLHFSDELLWVFLR